MIRQARERFSVWATLHDAELLLSLRVIVGGLLTFALGHLLRLPEVYWGVLTVVLVMQPSVGGALKATVERIIGTLGGAIWAIVVSVSLPHSNVLLAGVALMVALAPLAEEGEHEGDCRSTWARTGSIHSSKIKIGRMGPDENAVRQGMPRI